MINNKSNYFELIILKKILNFMLTKLGFHIIIIKDYYNKEYDDSKDTLENLESELSKLKFRRILNFRRKLK
jgi:hypothetical protein